MHRQLPVICGLFLCPSAWAGQSVELDELNVTANRTALTVDASLAPVEIITRQEIEQSQALDLPSLLTGRPGIHSESRGGYGSVSNLFLRGTNSNQLLVLIDGVRIGSATTGAATLNTLPLSQIERIEIVRGPRSSLYGADAIGGVIQIFTRKGQPGLQPSASLAIGSNQTRELNANLAGGNAATQYTLNASHFLTEGISAIKDNNPDRDGHENNSLSAGLSHEFSPGTRLDLQFLRSQGRTQYDDFFITSGEFTTDLMQQVAHAKLTLKPLQAWETSLSLGAGEDGADDAVYGDIFTRRQQLEWQNDLQISENQRLTAGVDLLRDEVGGSMNYSVDQRENHAVYGQYIGEFSAFNLTGGLRYDDNDAYGSHTTGNLSLGYVLAPGLRAIASYGSAFKAPTFNDLYYPGFSNPDLQPEESKSYDLGLTGEQAWGSWELRAFDNRIDQMIQYNPAVSRPENIAKARIRGLESRIDTQAFAWDVSASLTLLDPRDEITGELLQRRARKTLRLDADRNFGATGLGVTLFAEDSREDTDFNTFSKVTLGGYGLVDLRLSQPLDRNWTLRGQIKNLFDKEYESVYNYNTLGRELFVSVHYAPQP